MTSYTRTMSASLVLAVAVALISAGGCGGAVCPEGTYEFAGRCEPIDAGVADSAADGAADGSTNADASADAGTDSASPDTCVEQTFYRDADGDNYGDPIIDIQDCTRPQGYVTDNTDCDDGNAAAHPGLTLYRDMDGDNHGNPMMPMMVCQPTLAGYVASSDDCNDGCATCFPGGTEVCDGGNLDENCSMGANEGCACTNGMTRACPGNTDVGECVAGTQTCSGGTWGACSGAVSSMTELCDGRDNDCSSVVDDGTAAISCGQATRATAVGCSAGQCYVAACAAGYLDCDTQRTPGTTSGNNGCESQLGTLRTCTGCGDTCGYDCVSSSTGCNDYVSVHPGSLHGCGLREDGTVWCWGQDGEGQLGDGLGVNGISANTAGPVRVSGLSGIVEIGVGSGHSCARGSRGELWCWGENDDGQLGINSVTRQFVPVRVTTDATGAALPAITALAVGFKHTCAAAGSVMYCWGQNHVGQAGQSATADVLRPTIVSGVTAGQISAGETFTCSLASGTLRCWGNNHNGELGQGHRNAVTGPVVVSPPGGLTFRQVAAGGNPDFGNSICAVMSDTSVYCWGRWQGCNTPSAGCAATVPNGAGDLSSARPAQVMLWAGSAVVGTSPLRGVATVSAGPTSCAVTTEGHAYCWGWGSAQGVGVQVDHRDARQVMQSFGVPMTGIADIRSYTWRALGLTTSGTPLHWGGSGGGSGGDGIIENHDNIFPTPIAGGDPQ